LPSWRSLEDRLPSARAPEPFSVDAALQSQQPRLDGLVLFRERNGWCPYSERVWLALEIKGLSYSTVLIDNMGSRPSWFGGQTPQIRWPSGGSQGESVDILRRLDREFPESAPLWPNEEVTELVNAFKKITRPSSRAAFLFRGYGGDAVWRSDFEATLGATDELLGKYSDGPFFHGARLSAADCAWAPFLERYAAQLPCLHAGLEPRDRKRWPRLAAWYEAMDREVPAYTSRVKGDETSWRRVLAQAGFGNAGVAPVLLEREPADIADDETHLAAEQAAWRAFTASRAHVAATPHEEAAARIVRNHKALISDAARKGAIDESETDVAFRGCAELLADGGLAELEDVPPAVRAAVEYLDERMCVPRDMGVLPAKAIRAVAAHLRAGR